MKIENLCITFLFLMLFGNENYAQKQDFSNCLYDNDKTYALNFNPLYVAGEVVNPGIANTDGLLLHSVIVKETYLNNDDSIGFTGAYRYDGYSLKELLDPFVLNKKMLWNFPLSLICLLKFQMIMAIKLF